MSPCPSLLILVIFLIIGISKPAAQQAPVQATPSNKYESIDFSKCFLELSVKFQSVVDLSSIRNI